MQLPCQQPNTPPGRHAMCSLRQASPSFTHKAACHDETTQPSAARGLQLDSTQESNGTIKPTGPPSQLAQLATEHSQPEFSTPGTTLAKHQCAPSSQCTQPMQEPSPQTPGPTLCSCGHSSLNVQSRPTSSLASQLTSQRGQAAHTSSWSSTPVADQAHMCNK